MADVEDSDVPSREMTDAFGEALRDHHDGETAHEVIERDDGWIGPNGVESYFAEYDEWPGVVQRAMDRVEGRVLDVGCGAGRHALYLQGRGHDVTGIDVSPGAIEVARDRGVEDVRSVDVADVTDEFDAGAFDTVLMLGNNFGLVGTGERAADTLSGLAEVSADGATLLASSRDPTVTDDEHHLAYHDLNRERGRLPGALRIRVRYAVYATDWYDYLLAAPDTMDDLSNETDWDLTGALEPDDSVTSVGGDYVGILER